MNVSHLNDVDLQQKIKEMWEAEEILSMERAEDPKELLHRCLYKARKITHSWGKKKAIERRAEETKLREAHATTQLHLQSDP